MRVTFHPDFDADVATTFEHYRQVATRKLASDFYVELRRRIADAAANPGRFAVRSHDLRRVNLQRFPYHFLFRLVGDEVRILVLRHHRRHPSFGITRRSV